MTVRRLTPDDAPLLRSLRLRALSEDAEAFGSTYDREVAFTDDIWRARLEPTANPHFVDEHEDGSIRGLVAGVRAEGEHDVAYLVAMWVDPDARGTGCADRLVQRVIAWATDGSFRVVRLHVIEDNQRAERVYERNGFRRTGNSIVRERDGVVELEMERCLS